jgi:hypothetical protein
MSGFVATIFDAMYQTALLIKSFIGDLILDAFSTFATLITLL